MWPVATGGVAQHGQSVVSLAKWQMPLGSTNSHGPNESCRTCSSECTLASPGKYA